MKKFLENKKYFIFFIILIIATLLTISSPIIINTVKENIKKIESEEIEWRTYGQNGDTKLVLVTIRNENGIVKIKDINEESNNFELYSNGKTSVSFDYKMIDKNTYRFEATFSNGDTKIYEISYEKPRVKAEYTLTDNVYVNEPDVSKFVKEKTRYMYMNDEGYLVPGNWLTGEKPEDWYSYGLLKWANVYVESDGVDSYWVWIPRYVYKIDEENQFHGDEVTDANERMDVKFVNVYDEYVDPQTNQRVTWEELKAQGYKMPEAFSWKTDNSSVTMGKDVEIVIPGYWVAKYQLSEVDKYIINYELTSSETNINISQITTDTEKPIAKYIYAVNGEIKYPEATTPTDRSFDIPNTGLQTVNVTALDANGSIIGSMTKDVYITKADAPDAM